MAKLIGFTVSNTATSESGFSGSAPVRVAINGEGVPVFNPSDPSGLKVDEWLVTLDQLKEMLRWSDSAAIHFATAKLEGPAKVWWTHLKDKRLTWEEFHSQVKESFPLKENTATLSLK